MQYEGFQISTDMHANRSTFVLAVKYYFEELLIILCV